MIATNGCDFWFVWPREHIPVSCAGACRPSFDGCRHSSAVWLREAATQSTQEAWGEGSLLVGYAYSSTADSYETELGTFVSVVYINVEVRQGSMSTWVFEWNASPFRGIERSVCLSTSDLLNSNRRTVWLDWKAYPKEMQRSTYSSIWELSPPHSKVWGQEKEIKRLCKSVISTLSTLGGIFHKNLHPQRFTVHSEYQVSCLC